MKRAVLIFLGFFLMAGMAYGAPADKDKMSEDIQTMSRLIDGELQKEFSGKYTAGFWNQGCIGLYLKDYGVVFTARVQFPIFDYNEVKSEEKKEPSDLWEVYEKGLQPSKDIVRVQRDEMILRPYLQSGTDSMFYQQYMKYQANEIKKLEKFLTGIICKYADKIDRLSPDEYITIAVQGNRNFEPSSYNKLLFGSSNKPTEKEMIFVEKKRQVEGEKKVLEKAARKREEVLAKLKTGEEAKQGAKKALDSAEKEIKYAEEAIKKARENAKKTEKEIKSLSSYLGQKSFTVSPGLWRYTLFPIERRSSRNSPPVSA